MKKIYKIISLLLVFIMLFSLSGCKKKNQDNPLTINKEQEDLLHKTKAYNIFGDIKFTPADTQNKENAPFAYRINVDIDTNSNESTKPHSHGLIKYSKNADDNWETVVEFFSNNATYYWDSYNYTKFTKGVDEMTKLAKNTAYSMVKEDLLYKEEIKEKAVSNDVDYVNEFSAIAKSLFPSFNMDNLIKESGVTVENKDNAVMISVSGKKILPIIDKWVNSVIPTNEENKEVLDNFKTNFDNLFKNSKLPQDNTFKEYFYNLLFNAAAEWQSADEKDKFSVLTNGFCDDFDISIKKTADQSNGTEYYEIGGTMARKGIIYNLSGKIEFSSIEAYPFVAPTNFISYEEYVNAIIKNIVPVKEDKNEEDASLAAPPPALTEGLDGSGQLPGNFSEILKEHPELTEDELKKKIQDAFFGGSGDKVAKTNEEKTSEDTTNKEGVANE